MRVHILQPYVPLYRKPFFDGLRRVLADSGIDLRVYAGTPPGSAERRGDRASGNDWEVRVQGATVTLAGRALPLQKTSADFWQADAIVVGLMGTLPQAYLAALRRLGGRGPRVGYWGHVKSYVARGNRMDLGIERLLARRADQLFAYTPGGAAQARRWGVDPERITTVMNSVDTGALMAARAACTEEWVVGDQRLVRGGKTLAFVGGLDASKRVDFLAAALDQLWLIDPETRVVVAGRGEDEAMLDRAVRRGQVVRVGYADDARLAQIGCISKAIVMPGRVGLVAVHALALGLPVLTTDWPYHAPEFEYLSEGDSVESVEDSPQAFARAMADHAGRPLARRHWDYPTMERMVENFSAGIHRMMAV